MGLSASGVGAVEAMAAVAAHADQAHPAQHAEVFRNRRLIDADGHYDFAHLALVPGQESEDLAATGLGDGVEGIGGGCGPAMIENNTFPYGNMSETFASGSVSCSIARNCLWTVGIVIGLCRGVLISGCRRSHRITMNVQAKPRQSKCVQSAGCSDSLQACMAAVGPVVEKVDLCLIAN